MKIIALQEGRVAAGDVTAGHVAVWVVLVLVLVGVIVLVVLRPPRGLVVRSMAYGLGGIIALSLVARAIAEFFIVDYSNPASYRDAWGGPSLVGVFLVHAGPRAAIVVAAARYLFRRWRPRPDLNRRPPP